jgi:hypothetical protein
MSANNALHAACEDDGVGVWAGIAAPRQGFKPLATTKKIVPQGTTPPLRPLQGSVFPW